MKKQTERNGGPDTESTREDGRSVDPVSTTAVNGENNGILNIDTTTSTRSELPVPKAMANRNKKKGFLREMANVQGTKTVFGEDAQGSSTPLKNVNPSIVESTPNATPNRSTTWAQSRVIPPSELEVLPSNVFVTHVEYQRNGWTPRQRNQRGGQDALVDTSSNYVDGNAGIEESEEMDEEALFNDSMAVDAVEISPREESVSISAPAIRNIDNDTDVWTTAETRFDNLSSLTAGSFPSEGAVLAWKVRNRVINARHEHGLTYAGTTT